MNTAARLVLCGSFGYGNAGDEAVPLAVSDLARNRGISLDLRVLGRFPEPPLPGVIGLGPRDQLRREELRGLPFLVCGGGAVEPNAHSVVFRCGAWLRRDFAGRVGLWAANVESGVSYGWSTRRSLRRILRPFDLLAPRDAASERALRTLIPGREIFCVGDSVLWLEPDLLTPSPQVLSKRFIAVILAPRWTDDPDWADWLAAELAGLARLLDAAVLFLPFSITFDDDRPAHTAIALRLRRAEPSVEVHEIERDLPPRILSAVLERAVLAVSMRLHGCVMAYARKTPIVALSYHPKVSGFMETIGRGRQSVPPLPGIRPARGVYGHKSTEFDWRHGWLQEAARLAFADTDYEPLQYLKKRLADTLLNFLSG